MRCATDGLQIRRDAAEACPRESRQEQEEQEEHGPPASSRLPTVPLGENSLYAHMCAPNTGDLVHNHHQRSLSGCLSTASSLTGKHVNAQMTLMEEGDVANLIKNYALMNNIARSRMV